MGGASPTVPFHGVHRDNSHWNHLARDKGRPTNRHVTHFLTGLNTAALSEIAAGCRWSFYDCSSPPPTPLPQSQWFRQNTAVTRRLHFGRHEALNVHSATPRSVSQEHTNILSAVMLRNGLLQTPLCISISVYLPNHPTNCQRPWKVHRYPSVHRS